MRLKTRLTLLFLIVAWAPLGVAGWLMTERMETRFDTEFQTQSAAVKAAVGERFGQLTEELQLTLEGIAGDPILETDLLQPLKHGHFYEDMTRQRAMVRQARRLITSPSIDTLRIVDTGRDGHIIALAHRRGEEERDTVTVRALAQGVRQAVLLRTERVDRGQSGETEELWTLQVVRRISDRVALVGGKILSGQLLDSWVKTAAGKAHVALEVAGRRVVATYSGPRPPANDGGYNEQTSAVEERSQAQRPPERIATLRIWTSRDALAATRRQLWSNAAFLSAAAGLLALVFGFWLSARLSRPLEELADAASLVASGRRDPVVRETRGKDEISRLTRAFNQMTLDLAAGEERLRQSERIAAWREVARRIAHEIKNPLFPIQMSIETMQKVWRRQHPDFEEIFDESTETILEEVARMKRIVSEFSDFARMPAPRPQPCDLTELCTGVANFHRDALDELDIALEVEPEVWASVDPDQWRQVMTNLVQNAVDAMADASERRLRVVVRKVNAKAFIEVADTGPGMDAETQGRLFTPYFTTKAQGTGLGLAIVHKIVEEHGGRIRVSSAPGEGARFTIDLPALTETAPT